MYPASIKNPEMNSYPKNKYTVCTIIAKNYLALAKTLEDSLHQFHPEIDFHLLVIDQAGLRFSEICRELISLVDPLSLMDAEQFNRMAKEYDVTEFSTALKPFLLRHLISLDYEQVLYFDPDILIMESIEGILNVLKENNIVLTPHLLEPIPFDDQIPSELTILRAGAYNLGFIGVRASDETRRFLDWWSSRLDKLCKNAPHLGLFVDQKWIDLVPGLFDGVSILKNQGYNVAYWNIHSRHLIEKDGKYYVNNPKTPLIFYHFSGYNTNLPDKLSTHQDRVDINENPVLASLFRKYESILESYGHSGYRILPYTPGIVDGVNVVGYFSAELGTGEAARGYISALQLLKIKININNFTKTKRRLVDKKPSGFASENPYSFNLICVNADQIENFITFAGYNFIDGKTNIAVWWWELPEFPDIWKRRLEYFDQIWVGSEFVRETIQTVTEIPVIKISPVVEINLEQSYSKTYFGLNENEYLYLFIFDFLSVFERKNPLGIVRAFKQTFSKTESVRLVLKCINESEDYENFKRLQQEINDSKISIITGRFSRDEVNGLISIADCYISLHRSEGFGYTMAEAMYLAKPVIATGWSGNIDFMTDENSYLVNYELKKLEADFGPYRKGQIWAEPDIDHASSLMRQVYEDPEKATRIGNIASIYMKEHHSAKIVAKQIRDRLYEIPIRTTRKKKNYVRRMMHYIFTHVIVRHLMFVISKRVPLSVSKYIRNLLMKLGWY